MPDEKEIPDLESRKRLAEWSIVEYRYLGWRIWDIKIGFFCDCCHAYNQEWIHNASMEDIAYLASFPEAKFVGVGKSSEFDAWIRICRDIDQGAYDPVGNWSPYPVYQIEILESQYWKGLDVARKASQTEKLAKWVVREIFKRDWKSPDDDRGAVKKHASQLLQRYTADEIAGCLEAIRDGVIGDGFEIHYISTIESVGEPPMISQWKEYCANEPPVFYESEYQQWLERKNKHYDELEADPELSVQPADMLPAGGQKARRPRRRKDATAQPFPELYQGQSVSGSTES